MKVNPQQLPSQIFDWIERYSFIELQPAQQEEVRLVMNEAEYEELYQSSALIKSQQVLHTPQQEDLKRRVRELKKGRQMRINALFWKAASVLLLLSTITLGYMVLRRDVSQSGSMKITHDTLYIERAVMPAIAAQNETTPQPESPVEHKTKQPGSRKGPIPRSHDIAGTQPAKEPLPRAIESAPALDVEVVTLDDYRSPSNSVKRNSMKNDSFEKNFRFVSL